MKKKIQPIVIVLAIVIVLIIILLIVMGSIKKDNQTLVNGKKDSKIDGEADPVTNILEDLEREGFLPSDTTESELPPDDTVYLLSNKSVFYSIEKMITRYFLYLKAGNPKAVYSIIDDNYLKENNINEQNILENLRSGIPYDGTFSAKEIRRVIDYAKPIYFISGILEKDFRKTPYYLVMKQDLNNVSFSLKPISEAEYKKYIQNKMNETFDEDIELGDFNKITNISITDEDFAEKYFKSYIHNARYYPEEAYESLNEDYRKERFGSYQKYLEYLKSNEEELTSLDPSSIRDINDFQNEEEYTNYMNSLTQKELKKYYLYEDEDQKMCICVDYYGNYYIFQAEGVMNYTVCLDSYTIDLEHFLELYKNRKAEEVAHLNVERIFEAINDENFDYVYNHLEEELKKQYKNKSNFEKEMQNNLYKYNEVTYAGYDEDGDESIYKLTIKDVTRAKNKEIKMTVVMELGEDTEYIITQLYFEN